MKAQMEFIVILAMIIIAIVVIMVSSNLAVTDSDNPLITGIGEEKKTVKDSVLNSISSLVRSELREIYKNGGGEFSGNTVTYGVKEIGIWKDCDKSEVPNIKTILERGIESRIEKIFKSEMDFFGKEVRFDLDKLDISVNIQSNGVKFDVEMPTKFEGSDVPQPYSVMVPSRLKEIIEISDTITKNSDNSDFFESATLNTILFSNPEEKWMPTVDLITGCGNAFFKTDKDTLESIESTLKYTASHIVYDKEILNSGENPFYVLGISDLDIDVSFIYPEDWELGKNLAVKPSPSAFYAKPILSFSSACIETTDVRYSVRYPVIVMIKDDALHEIFNFA
ncbi:MAG: hypothetical protein KAS32_11675, partial [Candidatus Peribacteraceae bacterium]|nr:hypothetical protein [Candidatus Peribacteraceae bacterium]